MIAAEAAALRQDPAAALRPTMESTPVSSVDFAWRRMDAPTNLTVINGVLLFDEPLDVERLKATLAERLLPIPRFRHRVRVTRARAGLPQGVWEPDPDFDLDHHVQRLELEPPGDDRTLQAMVSELMSRPLDAGRPLWVFYVIDNYRGGSALLGRLHHCIGDGLALMVVLLSLADLAPDAAPAAAGGAGHNPLQDLFLRPGVDSEEARELVRRVMPGAMKLLSRPVEALANTSTLLKAVGSVGAFGRLTLSWLDPKTRLKGRLGVDKRVSWSEAVPLEEIRGVQEAFGGTVNDLLTTAMTGGLRRYLEATGSTSDGLNFRALVPVNLRPLEEMAQLGNRFGLVLLSLPVGIADPLHRLGELRRRMRALRTSLEPVVAYGILKGMGIAPVVVQRLVMRFFTAKATAVLTNVPGPQESLYLAGRRITGIMFWVPHPGALGLGISILSYAGEVRLGVATDAGLVPDPERIVDGFHREFEYMQKLAAG